MCMYVSGFFLLSTNTYSCIFHKFWMQLLQYLWQFKIWKVLHKLLPKSTSFGGNMSVSMHLVGFYLSLRQHTINDANEFSCLVWNAIKVIVVIVFDSVDVIVAGALDTVLCVCYRFYASICAFFVVVLFHIETNCSANALIWTAYVM